MISAFAEFETRMRAARVSDAAIRAFKHSYDGLIAGKTGLLPESEIQPVTTLPRLEEIAHPAKPDAALLSQTIVVKLNGGLGTSMGLERAKSLLKIKDDLTFLDFIARQIIYLREHYKSPLRFLLMNSFSTSGDTLEFLKKYPALGDAAGLEVMQSAVPKVNAVTLRPALWPSQPELEWCPPGHGDLYPSLLGSGWLDRLLAAGVKYLFVSNSDNLGASLDLDLLAYFANSGLGFMMEVCKRTASDRKGGHLAQRNGHLLLRESAQCPETDKEAFQDIKRHRFFNTNNLWLRLEELKKLLEKNGGFIPLPVIKNAKTIDPRDKKSPKIFQLETAMGAAIGYFERSGALIVPRTRFAPVKTTGDLLAMRSDAYAVTPDWRLELAPECHGTPPNIELDADHYKMVDQLDAALKGGVPSLKQCRQLKVTGVHHFKSSEVFVGKVTLGSGAKH